MAIKRHNNIHFKLFAFSFEFETWLHTRVSQQNLRRQQNSTIVVSQNTNKSEIEDGENRGFHGLSFNEDNRGPPQDGSSGDE